MTRGFCLLAILSVACCWPANAESDYDSERKALYESAVLSGSGNSSALIEMLFDKDVLVHNPCDMLRDGFAEELSEAGTLDCEWEPEISIEGISSEGQEALIAATETYDSFRLYTLNERARLFVAFCETGEIDPSIIAGKVSDIHDNMFRMELQFYQTAISELSESDIDGLERHNLEVFGIERPIAGDTYREIETALASRFPEEYRKSYINNCVEAVENKDLPFKQFRREPYREDCSRTTNTYGPDGQPVNSVLLSMSAGCATTEYYAQKPEMVGDKAVQVN